MMQKIGGTDKAKTNKFETLHPWETLDLGWLTGLCKDILLAEFMLLLFMILFGSLIVKVVISLLQTYSSP